MSSQLSNGYHRKNLPTFASYCSEKEFCGKSCFRYHSTFLVIMYQLVQLCYNYTVEHGYNELFYNEFMVIMNLSLHPVVISVFHCSSFITKLWL